MSRNSIILGICFAIVVVGLGYYFLFFEKDTGSVIVSEPGAASDAELSFITLVSKLDPIVFDTSLLSDPRFMSRDNIRTTIIPELSGRKDPFAPLGR